MEVRLVIISILLLLGSAWSIPRDSSFVLPSVVRQPRETTCEVRETNPPCYPEIYEMNITSNVYTRYATTLVTSKVRNRGYTAKEAIFTVVLSQNAFISEFVMVIDGKRYKAYVKEREEAETIYQNAVQRGQTAAHVAVNIRDTNRFTVSVNVEPNLDVTFLLTYEELLQRKLNKYEIIQNVYPGQVVENLYMEVKITESRPLAFVRTAALRSGNQIRKNELGLRPMANIKKNGSAKAVIKFSPNSQQQKQFAQKLGTTVSNGLAAQFVVEYDVERDSSGGEMLLQDGYFVHFFATKEFEPLPLHIVFALDISGSMMGKKIDQLKDAMNSILNDIRFGDKVSIIEFYENVNVWDISSLRRVRVSEIADYKDPFSSLSNQNLPGPVKFNEQILQKAKKVVNEFRAGGLTDLIVPLETALHIIKNDQDCSANEGGKKYQPIILFLTDGDPTSGIRSTDKIDNIVTRLNSENNNVPIFSLSFGDGAYRQFLKKLSLRNNGIYKHIYEASDASLQLQGFYKEISTPVLSHIKFVYDSQVTELTQTDFEIYMAGSEYIVAGKYKSTSFTAYIQCVTAKGPEILQPVTEMAVVPLERIWAYMTVKQILKERLRAVNKIELTKKAVDLALKYSFVTEVTSLVVVRPNDTTTTCLEDSSPVTPQPPPEANFGMHAYIPPLAMPPPHGPPVFAAPPVLNGVRADETPSWTQNSFIHKMESTPWYTFSASGSAEGMPPAPARPHYGLHGQPGLPGLLPVSRPVPRPVLIPYPANQLLWLASLMRPNGTFMIHQNSYYLGRSNYPLIATEKSCPQTPLNDTGRCAPLPQCPQVYSFLTDFSVYQRYFCAIDVSGTQFAGVCCFMLYD